MLLYALAWAGGAIAYTPLLTILLPVMVAGLAGKQLGVDWLGTIALAGAVAASFGGVVFGYLSDVTRNRRGWIFGGLVLSCVMLIEIGHARGLGELIAAIVGWQLALNMMLGPLTAWAGDIVPDHRKGLLGGLMAFAPGLGALSGAVVTQPGLAAHDSRLLLVAGLVALCVLPVLILPAPTMPNQRVTNGTFISQAALHVSFRFSPVVRMWFARLAVQVAEATLFAYLFFWLTSIDPAVTDNQTARLFSTIMLISAPLTLAIGRWSDTTGHPIRPLQTCALVAAGGLAVMVFAKDLVSAILGYAFFGLSSAVFLALHSAQTLRVLPRPDRRGRDLGLFNLANTIPSLVMPWFVMALVPLFGFSVLFILLAILAATAGLMLGKPFCRN